ADGNALAWGKIGRRGAPDARPAPVPLSSVAIAVQEVRPAWLRLVQKGRRYRLAGIESVAAVVAATQQRALRAGCTGASARSGRQRPYGADRRENIGVRCRGADGAGDQVDRSALWLAHTHDGRVHRVGDAGGDGPRFGRWGLFASPRPPAPWPH